MGGQPYVRWTTNFFPVHDPEKFKEATVLPYEIYGNELERKGDLFRVGSSAEFDPRTPLDNWWDGEVEIWDWEERVPAFGGKLTEDFEGVEDDFVPDPLQYLACFIPAETPIVIVQERWYPGRDGSIFDYGARGFSWAVGSTEDPVFFEGDSYSAILAEAETLWPDATIDIPSF